MCKILHRRGLYKKTDKLVHFFRRNDCAWCAFGGHQCGPGLKTGPESSRGNHCFHGEKYRLLFNKCTNPIVPLFLYNI